MSNWGNSQYTRPTKKGSLECHVIYPHILKPSIGHGLWLRQSFSISFFANEITDGMGLACKPEFLSFNASICL